MLIVMKAIYLLPVFFLAFCLAVPAAVQSKPAHMAGYSTVQLADGIYAFISPPGGQAIVTGNSLVVIGDDGALVVDSGHFPSVTARQITQIRQWTGQPVPYLVNTHWHPDHNAGNGLYRDAYPGIHIVSTSATRDGIRDMLPKKELSEQQVRDYAGVAERGVGPDGKPLTDSSRPYWQQVSREMSAFLPELKAARHDLPDLTFARGLQVFLGKREVRILFFGRGNTAGDAVVYVPDAKVAATGDLLVSPIPYPFGSFIGEWIETLREVDSLGAAVLVPGHGEPMRDSTYLRRTIELLAEVKRQTDDSVKAGRSLKETQQKVKVEGLRSEFTAADPAREFFFDHAFLPTAIARAYREAKEGQLRDED